MYRQGEGRRSSSVQRKGVFKLVDGVLQLLVQYIAVRHHNDGAEQLVALGVIELGQLVGGPGNGVGFAGPGQPRLSSSRVVALISTCSGFCGLFLQNLSQRSG